MITIRTHIVKKNGNCIFLKLSDDAVMLSGERQDPLGLLLCLYHLSNEYKFIVVVLKCSLHISSILLIFKAL